MSQLLSSLIYNLEESSMANDIIQTPEGDYIIVGRIYNDNKKDSGYAVRITSSGTIIWEQVYSSAFSQFLEKVTLLSDGTYVATGSYFYSIYSGDEYIWVVNFDKDGNIIWEEAYGDVGVQSDGYDVIATKDGGFIVSGLSNEESALTWLIKFDSKGKLKWNKKYKVGLAFSIVQTMDEGYALVGCHNLEDSLNSNPFIMRLDSKGNVIWKKIYSDYEIYVLLDGDIIENSNGHFTIVAKTLLMEVDACGNIIYKYENENLKLTSIYKLTNGNYVVSGSLVDNNYLSHSYVAILNRYSLIDTKLDDKKIIWENVDIKYNSGYQEVIEDKMEFLVGCGYISSDSKNVASFFVLFDINTNII